MSLDQVADMMDFGGKYDYLQALVVSQTLHIPFQQIAIYTFTIGAGLFTLALAIIFYSPFGRDSTPNPAGCRRYGLQGRSRLSDEHSSRHTTANKQGPYKVQSLWLYPIKSCQGVELDEAELVPAGIRYDRQYSFAQLHSPFPLSLTDAKKGAASHQWRFITQREFPLLSQVKTELWVPDPTAKDYDSEGEYVKTGGAIVVRFPFEEDGVMGSLKAMVAKLRGGRAERSFTIPFEPTAQQKKAYKLEEFKIWKDTPVSLNMSSIVPPELKFFLGVRNPFTLFRVHAERELFRCAPRQEELGWQPRTGFADAYPLNIMGLASVQALTEMQPPGFPGLSFKRFRGNIAMTGSPAFVEEDWTKIRIGGYEHHVCCRCVRCGIPNIDPKTGIKDKQEPYKTLVNQRNVDAGAPKYGCLGMQMVPVKEHGWIRVGDEITVLETGEHVYEPM